MADYNVVGKPLPRVDAKDKTRGEAKFTADMILPGMLWGKILRSPYAHARVLNVDTTLAERLPGVKAIITGKDTANLRVAFVDTPKYPADEPPFAVDVVRYVGDEVAAVAAVDEDTAEEAVRLIKVDYKELPAVFTIDEALRPGAPLVHEFEYPGTSVWEDWGAKGRETHEVRRRSDNVSARTFVSFGDLEKGFREADYIREDRFDTPVVAHAAMEPHAAMGYFDASGKLNIHVSSMGIFYKRFVLAKALGLPVGMVRILKSYVGGAFGGKIDVFPYEIGAALLAKRSGRPVMIELTREEVFTATRQEFASIINIKTGVKRDGTITAQDIKVYVDNGAYRGTGPVVVFLCYSYNIPVYRVPHLRYEGVAVYTNNPIKGPKRGHGAPLIRYAVDSHMDMIARELGMDVVDLMLVNAREKGDVMPTSGDTLHSCGLKECIERVTETVGWRERRKQEKGDGPIRRGIGISACSMFSGSPYYPFASASVIQLNDDGSATLFSGAVEMGQGSETTLSQVAAEELGVGLDDVRIVAGDTETCPIDFGSFLSGGAFVTGKAVRLAAADAKGQLLEVAAELLEARVEDLVCRDKKIYVAGSPDRFIPYSQAIAASVKRNNGNPILGRGHYKSVPDAQLHPSLATTKGRWTEAYGFAVQVAELEVDTRTGIVDVKRITTFHDCGFPLNPQVVEGQIDGCVSMALGQALREKVDLRKGQIFNPSFLNYRVPITPGTPEIVNGIVSTLDPKGPFGAKEVGEGAVAGVLAAVANAVYDATGVRIKTLPLTPDKILAGLEKLGKARP